MKVIVESIRKSETVADIWLDRGTSEKRPLTRPGDLLDIQSRLFSIAGVRDFDTRLRILVSRKGEVSKWLYGRVEGDSFETDFVRGSLFRPDQFNSLCIATGTGIAPFLCAHPDLMPNIIWGIRSFDQFPCYQEDLVHRSILTCVSEIGVHVQDVHDDVLKGYHPIVGKYEHVYLCGHAAMISDMTSRLLRIGYTKDQIEGEVFFT